MSETKSEYSMPPARIGLAIWYASPAEDTGVPCLITSLSPRSITCTLFAVDNRAGIPRDGVRHVSDPELSDNPDRSNGCWDYTDDQKQTYHLSQLVTQLHQELGLAKKKS